MNQLSPWRIRRLTGEEEIQPNFSRVPESDEVPLSHYWNILVKRRGIILPTFLIVFAAGAYFAVLATTTYTATATIKIEPQNPRVTGVGELQALDFRGEYDYHQTQFGLLQSRPLAARVITELGLQSSDTFMKANIVSPNPVNHIRSWILRILGLVSSYVPLFKTKTENSDAMQQTAPASKTEPELSVSPGLINRYLGFLQIAPIQKTRLVSVRFTTPDPALSQALANAHVQSFLRMNFEHRSSLTEEAREFLDQKRNELQQKLEKAEIELNRFRRAHGVVSVEKGENIVLDRLVDLNRQLTAARAQRIETESLYRTVDNRNYQDLTEVMRQGLVQQLKSNVASLEAEKARSATIFKPDHPRIQELNQQIGAARQALSNEVANVVRSIRSNYAAALAKERALEGEAQKQQHDALKLREVGVQYTVLQEEVNANRSLYESVLKRLNETTISNDLAISNMQVVERAAKPSRASGPNVPLYLLASIVSGLFLGIGSAFLREFVDSTIGTPDEVWRAVGLGTLGVVPHLKFLDRPTYGGRQIERYKKPASRSTKDGSTKELITNHRPLSIINEAYRTIRTSLLLSQAEKPPQVILLTSPSPGEGKTVTTLNLAIALARDGHNVLLVDGDMRKGCCHNRLGLTNNRGLSNVLTGGLSLDEGIQETRVTGLSLLSRGVPPPNPGELLGSRKMKSVLTELREQFDFILIDSPPVIAISDAAILSVMTDGILLVFDGQKTLTASAQKAVERLDSVRARFLGVILNAVNLNDPHYSYYRTYSRYYREPEENSEMRVQDAEKRSVLIKIKELLDTAAGKIVTEAAKKDLKANQALYGKNEWSAFKSVHPARRILAGDGLGGGNPPEIVSDEFIDRFVDVFVQAVGPVGPLILRDHVAVLGESLDAFPKARIGELVNSVMPEILHPEMRFEFEKKIAEEILNIEKH